MPRTLLLSTLVLVLVEGCTFTSTNYTPLNPAPRDLYARSPEDVEVFSSGPPTRPHVDMGVFTVEDGDLGSETLQQVVKRLRRVAGARGCDALVVAPPGSRSASGLTDRTYSYKTYSATCVAYRTPTTPSRRVTPSHEGSAETQ